jgi:glutathione S-transferase
MKPCILRGLTRAQVPSGLLPVLEIDGRIVTESAVIMQLLENEFPDHTPLLPPAGAAPLPPNELPH